MTDKENKALIKEAKLKLRALGGLFAQYEIQKFARNAVDEFIKSETMKTKPKKKVAKKKMIFVTPLVEKMKFLKQEEDSYHIPYELFLTRSGKFKWRKKARNKKIINHEYNTKAAALKGMKSDFNVTVAMGEFGFKDLTK